MYTQYFLDSSATDTPNTPSFVIPPNQFVFAKVDSVFLPLSFYPVGSHNNQIALKENGVLRFVAIPYGSYNAVNFPPALQTALGGDYTVTFDQLGKSITIENPNLNFSVLDSRGGSTGFALIGKDRLGGDSVAGHSFTGGAVDLQGTKSMFLVSPDLVTRSVVVGNMSSVNALALIDCDSPNGSYVKWVNQSGWLTFGTEISNLRFSLIDSETLQRINLRGRGFTVSLSVLSDVDDIEVY